MGSVGQQPDPSAMAAKQRQSNRIQVKNLPPDMMKENLEHLLSSFGTLLRCDLVNDDVESYMCATYETPDQAESAVQQLGGYDIHGFQLDVQVMPDNINTHTRRSDRSRYVGPSQGGGNMRNTSYPLRILVPSELVGAVIGKKGVTIRNITTQCKARVDVHGKDNSGLIEKMISIFGQPENCSNACREILQVVHNEPAVESRGGMVPLKMLIDDRYCGRIIGKEGKIVKKIREDTSTKITISSVQEMAVIYPDRVITIQGTVENMVAAQAAISAKLAECIERDMQSTGGAGNMMMMPGAGPMMPPVGGAVPYSPNMRRPFGGAMMPPQSGFAPSYGMPSSQFSQLPGQMEMCQIIVPDKAVGAIIGAGGSMIKQIMEDSGAHVTVEPRKEGDSTSSPLERVVTIRGNPDACWKASYFVFEKVKDESIGATGGAGDTGEIKLRTMLTVPRSVAGRIIGRQGKNVREVQRMTGATVKLSEEVEQTDEVIAEVYGNFMATQGAHSRIRALISEDLADGPASYPPGPPQGGHRFPPRRPVQQQA